MSLGSTTSTAVSVAGGLLGAALVIWPLAVWYEVRRCEKPNYRTLYTLGKKPRSLFDRQSALEIREYDSFVLAEVTVEDADMRQALAKGFRQVAGFIFGGNVRKDKIAMTSPVISEEQGNKSEGEKIAMTSPVTTEMQGPSRYKIAFVMPSKYKSKEDLPKPKNSAIQLTDVPLHTLAAISWRGWPRPSEEVVKSKEKELREALKNAGVEVEDNAVTRLYQYYPPFAPTPIRRQDVLLPVKRLTIPAPPPKIKSL